MAEKTPTDLNALVAATKNLADAVKAVATQAPKAAKGIDGIHDDAKRTHPQVKILGDQLSRVLGATTPLDGMLKAVNEQLITQAATARLAAEAMEAQAAAAERVAKAQVSAANAGAKAATTVKKSGAQSGGPAPSEQIGKLGGAISSAVLGVANKDIQSLIGGVAGVAEVFATASAEGVGFGAVLAGLAAEAAPLIALTLPLAAIGGLAYAFVQGSKESAQFRNSLTITGNYAGLTADKFNDMAESISKANDTSFRDTKQLLAGAVSSGKYTAETMALAVDNAQRFSKFTGEDASKILADYDRMRGGVAKFAAEHALTYHDLTLEQIKQIDALEKANKHREAEHLLMQIINKEIKEKGEPAYGYLEKAALKVTNLAKDMWDAILGIGREKTIGDQLAEARENLKKMEDPHSVQSSALKRRPDGQYTYGANAAQSAESDLSAGRLRVNLLTMLSGGMDKGGAKNSAQEEGDKITKWLEEQDKKGQAPQDTTRERIAQLAQALAAAKGAELQAQLALTQNVERRATYERQVARAEAETRQAEISSEVARIKDDKGVSGTKKKELLAGYKVVAETEARVADLKQEAIDRREARDLVEREIAQRTELAGFTDRQVQSQIALAATLEEKQALERQALVDRQTRETDFASKRRWQDVVDGKLGLVSALRLGDEQRKATKGERDVKDEEDRRAIVEHDLNIRKAGLQNLIDIAESEADLARSAGKRRQIEAGILKARHDLQVASIDAAILTTKDLDARAQLVKDRDAADGVYANQVEAAQRLDVSYGDMSSALKNAASALDQKDWLGATKSLFDAFETFALKMRDSGASLESKIGAIAGLANGLGSMIGGKTGAALSGAGSGAAAGFQVGGPWGAAVGAVLGGVSGLLGASNAKAQAKIDALMKAQQDLQAKQKESSGAIEKSLGLAGQYQNTDLDYSNAMLASLRSIDAQIGLVAAGVARSIAGGGLMSTSGLGLGTTTSKAGLGGALVGGALGGIAGFGVANGITALAAGGMMSAGGISLGLFTQALSLAGPIGIAIGAVGAIVGALTKTKKTVEVLDQGLTFTAQTFGQITTNGLAGSQYADLLTTKKTSFAGIGLSTKVSTSTVTSGLDPALLAQIGDTIELLGEGVITAAKTFGEDAGAAAKAALQSVSIDLGKLSLKDLKPDEIEAAINALFNNVADDLAAAGLPGLQALAKAGEGAFEALTRLATEYKTIDGVLASVGMDFKSSGIGSLEARKGLLDKFGGLDAFASQTAFFGEHFLTDQDRLKPLKASVASGLAAIGQPADLSREGFKTLVQSQNLSTEEGAQLYKTLMALAPAFDKVATAAENVREKQGSIQDQIDELTMTPAELLKKSRAKEMDATTKLDETLGGLLKTLYDLQDAAEAAKLATDRSNMLASLMEAQGRTEEAKQLRRALALAQIEDPLQQMYQQQIWAAEDAAEKVSAARDVLTEAYRREQDAIQATKDKFKELSNSLRAFSASLTDTIAGTDPGARYRRTRETFLSTAAMARLGDPDAMGRLQNEGEAFTAASRDYVSTSLDYLRDVGLVRNAVDEAADTADRQVSIAQRQLDALDASVQGLIQINASVVSVEQAILNLRAANQAAAAAGVVSVGGQPVPAPTNTPSTPAISDAQKELNNAAFWWGMTNSDMGRATANDPSDINKYAQGMAAKYSPGYMDIVNSQGIDAANALVEAGKLTYTQGGSLKFATGGGFEVGGSGPPDSKLFNLALSPGEAVNVRRRGDSGDETLVAELRRLRDELADLRATSARIATSNDKMERTLTNVTEGGRAMQTQAAA